MDTRLSQCSSTYLLLYDDSHTKQSLLTVFSLGTLIMRRCAILGNQIAKHWIALQLHACENGQLRVISGASATRQHVWRVWNVWGRRFRRSEGRLQAARYQMREDISERPVWPQTGSEFMTSACYWLLPTHAAQLRRENEIYLLIWVSVS